MSKVDILSKNRSSQKELLYSSYEYKHKPVQPAEIQDADLLAKHLIDIDPSSEGLSHLELGYDIGRYGYKTIAIAGIAYASGLLTTAAVLGTAGALMLPVGIVIATVGGIEAFQEAVKEVNEFLTKSTNKSSFHLMDPKDLNLNRSNMDKISSENNFVLDKDLHREIQNFFVNFQQRTENLKDSIDGRTKGNDMGRLSDNDRRNYKLGSLSERPFREPNLNRFSGV